MTSDGINLQRSSSTPQVRFLHLSLYPVDVSRRYSWSVVRRNMFEGVKYCHFWEADGITYK